DKLSSEINDLTAQYDAVEAEIRRESPSYATLVRPQPVSAGEIQQKLLDENTVLLEYELGGDRSYLWAVSTKEIKGYELPRRSEIEDAARTVREALSAQEKRAGESVAAHQIRSAEAERTYWREAAKLSRMLFG